MKAILCPIAILFACVLAGFYGVVHNQISYSVSPAYFHEFKFLQFAVEPHLQNRIGASLVGWMASWWMGILIGLPIYFAALFVRGNSEFVKVYIQAAIVVVCATLLLGVSALLYGYISISIDNIPAWALRLELSDPVSFSRAGNMHNFSYLGGSIGLLLGLIFTIRAAFLSRHNIKNRNSTPKLH